MKPIESAIVRIFAQNKTSIVGVGFLIDGKRVMTCAHVVAKAFGIARDTSIQDLPAERITLDFPLVDDNHPCTASVVLWLPPMPDETGDIAVLEFDQQRPFSTAPVKLVEPSKYWDKPFGTYGYPQSIGGWASGVVRGRIAGNRLQIINKDEKSYFIQPGFSGSPVYCDEAGVQGVIGMVASGETDPNLDVGFMIPAEVLLKAKDQQNVQPLPSPKLTEIHKANTGDTTISGDEGSATHVFSREFAPRVVYIGKFAEMQRQLKLKRVFVAHPFFGGDAKEMDNYRYFFKDGLESIGYEPLFARDNSGYMLETICRDIIDTEAGIYDVTGYNANVLIELGMSIGLNQPTVVIAQDDNAPLIPPLQQLNPIRYASRYDLTDLIGPAVRQRIEAYRQSGMSPRFCASCGLDCIARRPRQSPEAEYLVIGADPHKDKAIFFHLKKVVKNFEELTWQQLEGDFNLEVCRWTEEIKRCKLIFFHSKEGLTRHSGTENAATMVRVGIAVGMGIAWRMILKQEERMPTDLEGLKYALWTQSPIAFEIVLGSAVKQILNESRPYEGRYDPLVPIDMLAEEPVELGELPQSNTEARFIEQSNSETVVVEDARSGAPGSNGHAPYIVLFTGNLNKNIKSTLASVPQLLRELKHTTEADAKLRIWVRIIQAHSYSGFEDVTQELVDECLYLVMITTELAPKLEFYLSIASFRAHREELQEAIDYSDTAYNFADQLRDNLYKARALLTLSITHRLAQDLDASEDYIQSAMELSYANKPGWHLGVLLCELAGLRYEQGNHIDSEKLYLQAKAIFDQPNSSHLTALAMHGLGLVWTKMERYDEARVALHGALDEYRWTGNNFRVADIQFALGCCEALAGSPKVALKLLRSADNVANRLSQSPARDSLLYRIHSWQSRLRND